MNDIVPKNIDKLVMGTVNASFKVMLDANKLAHLIADCDVEPGLPHLATFFGEVRDKLILEFAQAHGISLGQLQATYKVVNSLTGEANISLEQNFAHSMGLAA
jgi:hypothetical protein